MGQGIVKIHATPEIVEAIYELLRLTPPFKGWRLPHADEVEFTILRTKDFEGDYHFHKGRHVIRISHHKHKTLAFLTMTIAHEMIHMRDQILGVKSFHGKSFQRMADQVCRYHGFDRGQFGG